MLSQEDLQIINAFAQTLYDKKGCNILGLDVSLFSTMTDAFMIAEGSVEKHLQAEAKSLLDCASSINLPVLRVEGLASGEWIVLDFGFLVIHLMTSDMRERYALEELWREAAIIDLTIAVEKTCG
jgi:ribosome-associated protein